MSSKIFEADMVHSTVGFIAKHMSISNVRGDFKDYESTIDFDVENKIFNKLEVNIKVASINTSNEARDNHLKNPDFFDNDTFPNINFIMTEYVKENDEEGVMKGNLTIKSTSLPIKLNTQINGIIKDENKDKIGLSLNGSLNRKDFDVGESIPSLVVGDKIKLDIELEILEK